MNTKTKIKFALSTLALCLFASHNPITACCSRHRKSNEYSAQIDKQIENMQYIILLEPDNPCIYKKLTPYKHLVNSSSIVEPKPLYLAIAVKRTYATTFLLENGANPNTTKGDYEIAPLTTAVKFSTETRNHFFITKLLQYGANPIMRDPFTHKSPLEFAIQSENLAAVRIMEDELAARARWSDLRSAWVGTVVRVSAGPKAPAPIPQDRCTLS